ncbi:MAG: DUF3131 domain-containing protein [Bacteroidota bacterium]
MKKIVLITTIISSLLFISGCGVVIRGIESGWDGLTGLFKTTRSGKVTPEETEWAKTAWKYFENNYNGSTGLVNTSEGFQSTTMWGIGDYLMALVSAYEFEIINRKTFDTRLTQVFSFLNYMPLYENKLPATQYNTGTGKSNLEGWSAQDIGRLLIALKIVREHYPEYGEYIDKAVLRWNYCDIIDTSGNLYSGYKSEKGTILVQDAKLGFKEYAARGFQAWGFSTKAATSPEPYDVIRINGVDVYFDGRDERLTNSVNAVVALPYILDGIEFQWQSAGYCQRSDYIVADSRLPMMANAIYKVQEKRYEDERILTARSSHNITGEPYFVFDAIFANGYPWSTISGSNKYLPQSALVSTKAAFGMWVLWRTPYTDKLIALINTLFDAKRGWYEGRSEASGKAETALTCSTNSTVLESLLFKKNGMIYTLSNTNETFYDLQLQNEFKNRSKCLQQKENSCK